MHNQLVAICTTPWPISACNDCIMLSCETNVEYVWDVGRPSIICMTRMYSMFWHSLFAFSICFCLSISLHIYFCFYPACWRHFPLVSWLADRPPHIHSMANTWQLSGFVVVFICMMNILLVCPFDARHMWCIPSCVLHVVVVHQRSLCYHRI